MRGLLASVLLVFATSALAQTPTIKLDCAKVPNNEMEAERQYLSKSSGGGDIYNLNITFTNKRPKDNLIDKTLRECLAVAIKLDDKKDILANAWLRRVQGANPNDDEQLNPYGVMKYISYTALTKSIDVHSIELPTNKNSTLKPDSPPVFEPVVTARGMCMLQIKATLHDPDSAEFEHSDTTRVSHAGDIWTVQRPVRAKNAFNAMRYAIFECKYLLSGEHFKLISLKQISP